jgi:transposase-like protein
VVTSLTSFRRAKIANTRTIFWPPSDQSFISSRYRPFAVPGVPPVPLIRLKKYAIESRTAETRYSATSKVSVNIFRDYILDKPFQKGLTFIKAKVSGLGVKFKPMKAEFNAEELNLIKLAQEYSDPDKARTLLESMRWPHGATCPHCKAKEPYKITPKETSKRPARQGLYKCRECRKQFTVTVGTIFEDSHIPISKWLMAIFILCSSKKGISAHQLHRMLGITYKTAWFMAHRIRFAMTEGPLSELLEGTVEVDETYVGGKPRHGDPKNPKGGYRKDSRKVPVVALVQRKGKVRANVIPKVNQDNLRRFIGGNISKSAFVNTDEALVYRRMFDEYDRHDAVNHGEKEYARTNADGSSSHVNSAESFFSLLKRGVMGAFHHVSPEHLHRYVNEFSFRWNNRSISDGERLEAAVEMVEGKRLTYRQTAQ